MGALPQQVWCHGPGCTARRGHKKNDAILVPGCSAPRSTIRQCDRGAAGDIDLLQFAQRKNPMDRLLGDQKGKAAFSVPSKARAESEPSGRTHNGLPAGLSRTATPTCSGILAGLLKFGLNSLPLATIPV